MSELWELVPFNGLDLHLNVPFNHDNLHKKGSVRTDW